MFLPVADALAKAVLEFCKRRMEYVAPGDDDIVVSGRHCKPGGKTDRLTQNDLPAIHTAEELARAIGITTDELAWLCYHRTASGVHGGDDLAAVDACR